MSENHTHHHHHHHHHKMDGASKFKFKSLRAIERNKAISKWSFRVLLLVALLMILAVMTVYMVE